MRKVSGRERLTHVLKKKGFVYLKKEEAKGDGRYVERSDVSTERFELVNSRTISLSQFEFAKIGMGITAALEAPSSEDGKDDFFRTARRAIDEILDREVANIRNEKYKNKPVVFDVGIKRSVWMSYGLTLPGEGRYESNKFEVAATRMVGDGDDMGAVIEELQDYLTDRIGEERDRICGTQNEKTGL